MKYHPEIETLLKKWNVSPLKRYGQNFLVNESIIQTIVDHASLQAQQHVLEIGPGLGAITSKLPLATIQYLSYEIDQTFHKILLEKYPQGRHLLQNFLKAKTEPIDIIIGNLPYYATTEIIEKIYKDFSSMKRAILMVQKEVLPRLIGEPGQEGYGPLAIFIATMGTIHPIQDVLPVSFYPEPHVDSVIFRWEAFAGGPLVDTKAFFYFIKKLFLHRRKTILNNLSAVISHKESALRVLTTLSIEPNTRPEMISVQEYVRLFKEINTLKTL